MFILYEFFFFIEGEILWTPDLDRPAVVWDFITCASQKITHVWPTH